MPDERSRFVEVFDLAVGPTRPVSSPGAAASDDIEQGNDRPARLGLDRWSWWARADGLNRILGSAGALGIAVALVAGYGALTAHPGKQFFVDEVTTPAAIVGVDALGCPRGSSCRSEAVPAQILAVVRSAFPSARVTYALQTADVRSGRVYRREIDLSATQTTVRIVSQCVPGSGPIAGQAPAVTVDTGDGPKPAAADKPAPAGLKRITVTLPGQRGCSLFTEADTTLARYRIGGESVDTIVGLVSDNPIMMVTP